MSTTVQTTTSGTGPTITKTTTSGAETVLTQSGASQPTSTTTTTTYRSSPSSNGKNVPSSDAAIASGSQVQDYAPRPDQGVSPPARALPHDAALHEFNPHHGLGETSDQHAEHSKVEVKHHWGLPPQPEKALFYVLAIACLCFEIAASVLGSWFGSSYPAFIATVTVYCVLHWAAWFQTAVGMVQRSSWVRDESNLPDRRRYLYFAVRLNRLMLPSGVIAFVTFLVAYARRKATHDLAAWLLFLLFFILDIVFSVMNAYNNISWESDRLEYEEGSSPYGNTLLAIFGIPSKPRPSWQDEEHERTE